MIEDGKLTILSVSFHITTSESIIKLEAQEPEAIRTVVSETRSS
jgi:hypothetical protein